MKGKPPNPQQHSQFLKPEARSLKPNSRSPKPTMPILLETRKFRVEELTHDTPRGPVTRQVVRHPGAVVLLPLLPEGRICLIENYRAAVDRTLLELPAGTREPNEPPEKTAARELIEETGYRAGRIELLTEFFVSPGILDERMLLYLATELTPGPPEREHGEQIENREFPFEEALGMALQGKIEDAKTLIGLLLARQLGRA